MAFGNKKMTMDKTWLILFLLSVQVAFSFLITPSRKTSAFDCTRVRSAGRLWSSLEDDRSRLEALQKEQTKTALIEALLELPSSADPSLISVKLVGRTPPIRGPSTAEETHCVVLSAQEESADCLLVPLRDARRLKLLLFAAVGRPLSKSVLLGLNALLVNRDDGLFDNLPWSQWSVDPQRRNRDAAGNPIDAKYHLGKRDAYNRFLGKDWQGRSVSIGNMAKRAQFMLTNEKESTDDSTTPSLARRILELQIKELKMDLAECESQLAIASVNNHPNNEIALLEGDKLSCQERLEEAQASLEALERDGKNRSVVSSILERIADWSTDGEKNKAPYRGAAGYAPMLDTEEDIEKSILPYTSPYDFLKEVIDDQLNAEVIGVVLEDASLLRGNLVLGGVLVLQRKITNKKIKLAGEEVTISDTEEEFGNEGVKGGTTILVECDVDEAIGMALACSVPIRVESTIWNAATVPAKQLSSQAAVNSSNIWEMLPMWGPVDPNLTFSVEGDAGNATEPKSVFPLSIPRTTASLWDSIFEEQPQESGRSSLFPTDNPIKTLQEYDELSNEDKARTLLSLSNFNGKLPRPRTVRTSEQSDEKLNPLDQLLLPLVDEVVRRQYYIREAEERGDYDRVRELEASKSRRQSVLEEEEDAEEAEFLESLRADVTQDEGAYNRFLDRDEWYERERQATAKRVNKKMFGTLLDGIE